LILLPNFGVICKCPVHAKVHQYALKKKSPSSGKLAFITEHLHGGCTGVCLRAEVSPQRQFHHPSSHPSETDHGAQGSSAQSHASPGMPRAGGWCLLTARFSVFLPGWRNDRAYSSIGSLRVQDRKICLCLIWQNLMK